MLHFTMCRGFTNLLAPIVVIEVNVSLLHISHTFVGNRILPVLLKRGTVVMLFTNRYLERYNDEFLEYPLQRSFYDC